MKKAVFACLFVFIALSVLMPGPLHADVVDRIIAIVNDEIITLVDIQKESAPYIQSIESAPYSDDRKEATIKKLQGEILDRMIERSLTQQEAARYGISISDEDVDAALKEIRGRKSLTEEEFEQALGYEGITLQDFRENIQRQILQSRIIAVAVKSKVVITRADVKAYYEANMEKYEGTRKHHLRNILMQDKDRIADIKDRLDQGQSFLILAKQFSTAANAPEGGDLGLFDISGFSPAIKESIEGLEVEAYTDVIETAQGYQIFYLQDIILDGQKSLDEVSGEIEEVLYQETVDKKFKAWLETLKENAHIKKML